MLGIWYKKNIINWILYPISIVYGFCSKLNIILRSKKAYRSNSFIISVGNISIGGAGKTPLTVSMANFLAEQGVRVAVVGHGYKSTLNGSEVVDDSFSVEQIGDEAKQMLKLLNPEILLLVGKNRVDSVKLAEERKAEVIILDDGFTASYIKRDFNIMVVDGKTQLGNKMIFPAGPLREPISGLKRADSVVVINRHRALDFEFDKNTYYLKSKIDFKKELLTTPLFAFCGLAIPSKFYNSLNKEGLCVKKTKSFADHYSYKDEDIEKLVSNSKSKNLRPVTTLKDMVKIPAKYRKEIDVINIKIELTKGFKQDLLKAIRKNIL
ncbi:MAG: tetraacyldisaccharide 4'-kinase [Proteobacteria bacterium]|nr:tetraacyldisaccharide 4'-kinase [Pseudomonadota bacterium]